MRGIAPKPEVEDLERWEASHTEQVDHLIKLEWVQGVLAAPGMQTLLTCGAMSKPHELDQDHLFLSMLREDLIKDISFLWGPQQCEFHTLIALGPDVCGHKGIVHGGFTSAVIDETTGGLVYELKKTGQLGEGPAFTARLEVDYKLPLPAGTDIICTARVAKVEGRKVRGGAGRSCGFQPPHPPTRRRFRSGPRPSCVTAQTASSLPRGERCTSRRGSRPRSRQPTRVPAVRERRADSPPACCCCCCFFTVSHTTPRHDAPGQRAGT